jgi:hypothetical protein
VEGNKHADQLAQAGSEKSIFGPAAACSIPRSAIKQQPKDWTKKQHTIYWKDTPGHSNVKLLLKEPSCQIAVDLLK